ncbi:protein-L-isoaspartate O-methyltransferase 1 isoform X1 [Populus alba x Populus x berolinensis]|nr:protein-L-isoaspartate O-methyltransferase 1 isoform X1 [Populus alba x Populus x berolinensis]
MPISLSLPAGVIAYGYRNYSPPLKRLLAHNNNDIALFRYLYLRSSCNHIPSQLTSLFCFKFFPTNLNCLLTGNSLFFRMEGNLFQVGRTYYVLLALISGTIYFHSSDTQFFPSPGALDLQSQPIAISNVERFWSGSSINKNKAMVEHLQHYGVISSKKVSEVMETIDRALFVPDGTPAYVDSPMAIGYNATISAPHMHATCLQLLEENLKPGMHALDVGSGTGYLTACLALMVGPQGRAVGVEHIPELANSSLKNIEKSAAAPLLKEGSLSIHVGDGRQGWPEFAPYDCIHVGAAAPEIPQPLLDQLKPGGRMVIPVGNIFQDLKVVDKKEDGSISVRSETSVRYVPLTSRDAQLRGY